MSYEQGFIEKCAQHGVDPNELVKYAQEGSALRDAAQGGIQGAFNGALLGGTGVGAGEAVYQASKNNTGVIGDLAKAFGGKKAQLGLMDGLLGTATLNSADGVIARLMQMAIKARRSPAKAIGIPAAILAGTGALTSMAYGKDK